MDLPALLAAVETLDADSLAQVRQVADGRAAVLAAGVATVDYGHSCERCGVRSVRRADLCTVCLTRLGLPHAAGDAADVERALSAGTPVHSESVAAADAEVQSP